MKGMSSMLCVGFNMCTCKPYKHTHALIVYNVMHANSLAHCCIINYTASYAQRQSVHRPCTTPMNQLASASMPDYYGDLRSRGSMQTSSTKGDMHTCMVHVC